MCEVSALSVALFASMHALTCAEAQLHEKERERNECETCIVSALDHAMRVAHASCEAALTRVEPLYDAAVRDAAEYALCNEMVASALENAKMIVSALEFASTQSFLSVDACGDAAMRAAILTENIGAVALGVVMLSEFTSIVPPRGLFLLSMTIKSVDILRVLLLSSRLVAHITDLDEHNNTVLMLASMFGHTEAVMALLTCPAVVATAGVTNYGTTVLMIAVMQRHVKTAIALLCCPAVVATVGVAKNGFTALMIAEQTGHARMVQLLRACNMH
jgi:Ankyrin repeats (3 copies)/Ankyrin repeat